MARKIVRDAVLKREGTKRTDRAEEAQKGAVDREVSDDERVEMLRQSYFQSALPDLPKIPGYHTMWLTTQNPRDPVVGRERIGYTLLKASEIPNWEFACQKGGQYDGCIMVNEMIGAKIRLDLYERFMKNNHHDEPLFQERALVASNQAKKEEAAQYGAQLIESPGMVALGQDPGAPSFADDYGES